METGYFHGLPFNTPFGTDAMKPTWPLELHTVYGHVSNTLALLNCLKSVLKHADMTLEVNTQHFCNGAVPGLLKPEADMFSSVSTLVCRLITSSIELDIFSSFRRFFIDSQKFKLNTFLFLSTSLLLLSCWYPCDTAALSVRVQQTGLNINTKKKHYMLYWKILQWLTDTNFSKRLRYSLTIYSPTTNSRNNKKPKLHWLWYFTNQKLH